MNFKWGGPIALLAALVIGDQIRINRPAHKYRLSVEVETSDGVKTKAGVMAVHPYRGYSPGGKRTQTKGDAVFVDLGGGRNLVALLAHGDNDADLDATNYVALHAAAAAGRRVSFSELNRVTGAIPVSGELIPVLLTFADPGDPKTARRVRADDLTLALGSGIRLRGVSAEIVPNGLWPLDFGGVLGEPVTRGIEAKLPWLKGDGDAAAQALQAAGLAMAAGEANMAFTRK